MLDKRFYFSWETLCCLFVCRNPRGHENQWPCFIYPTPYLTFKQRSTCRKAFLTKCKCLLIVWWIIQIIQAFIQGLEKEQKKIMKCNVFNTYWDAEGRGVDGKLNRIEEQQMCRQAVSVSKWIHIIFQHGEVVIWSAAGWPLMQCICIALLTSFNLRV